MKQVRYSPCSNKTLTIATYVFTATAADGTITGTGVAALEKGQSIILGLTGATAQGYTKNGEYFVIPVDTTHIKVASSKANALSGTAITATGDAGGGTIYPNYAVGGRIYIGTAGNINIRGIEVSDTGTTSFSLHKNCANGTVLPFMVKDVCALSTTATDLVVWCD